MRYRRQSSYENFRWGLRKIIWGKKILDPIPSLSCVQTSGRVLFGYRKSLEKIRRLRNVTIYYCRQVPLEPVKSAMLSPVMRFDWLFSRNYVFLSNSI